MYARRRTAVTVGIACVAALTAACGGAGNTAAMGQQGGVAAGGGMAPAAAAGALPQGMPDAQAVAAGMGADGAPVVTVTATDTSCMPDTTTVKAGKAWFRIVNQGTTLNELYLETAQGAEIIEVEDVAPGAGGAFSYTVQPGQMMVSCKPGMQNANKVRTPITITP